MNIKFIKTLLISLPLLFATAIASADVIPESPMQKEKRLEQDVNDVFMRALKGAAYKLGQGEDVHPFAIIKKRDGSIGMFELDVKKNEKKLTVNQMAINVRRYLTELAIADQIVGSTLVMYATIQPKGEEARQGLTFEIEHIDGVSLMRFIPITDPGEGKDLIVHTEAVSTAGKPATVFTDMVRAVVANKPL
jgi:hypothetical protein